MYSSVYVIIVEGQLMDKIPDDAASDFLKVCKYCWCPNIWYFITFTSFFKIKIKYIIVNFIKVIFLAKNKENHRQVSLIFQKILFKSIRNIIVKDVTKEILYLGGGGGQHYFVIISFLGHFRISKWIK